jgi:hypothetical protein
MAALYQKLSCVEANIPTLFTDQFFHSLIVKLTARKVRNQYLFPVCSHSLGLLRESTSVADE